MGLADGQDEFEYVRTLQQEQIFSLLSDYTLNSGLSRLIGVGVQALKYQAVGAAKTLSEKFKNEGSFTFSFGGLNTFFGGLEGLVGTPNPELLLTMTEEHANARDSFEWFEVKNTTVQFKTSEGGTPCTMSLVEWYFVVEPDDAGLDKVNMQLLKERPLEKPLPHWPLEVTHDLVDKNDANKKFVREAIPLSTFLDQLKVRKINKRLAEQRSSEVVKEEVISLRLYTGPMYTKYNLVLRAAGDWAPDSIKKDYAALCKRNKYTTTLHVINSAVVKMGKLTQAGTVYRGISGGVLPDEFWESNEFGVCGGIEYAFMSTTQDREVAFAYAKGNRLATILEIRMGMVDRGASVEWLSQYPSEREILFAPLTGLEVTGKKVDGQVLVVSVRLNVNMMSQTIEEVIAKMQRSHLQMLDTMIARQMLDLTEQEVGPLHSLRDKAMAVDATWFNNPENFEAATNFAMDAQRQIVISGVKSKRLRVKGASQLRSAASFAARTNDPVFALQLLYVAEVQATKEAVKRRLDAGAKLIKEGGADVSDGSAEAPSKGEGEKAGKDDADGSKKPHEEAHQKSGAKQGNSGDTKKAGEVAIELEEGALPPSYGLRFEVDGNFTKDEHMPGGKRKDVLFEKELERTRSRGLELRSRVDERGCGCAPGGGWDRAIYGPTAPSRSDLC